MCRYGIPFRDRGISSPIQTFTPKTVCRGTEEGHLQLFPAAIQLSCLESVCRDTEVQGAGADVQGAGHGSTGTWNVSTGAWGVNDCMLDGYMFIGGLKIPTNEHINVWWPSGCIPRTNLVDCRMKI